MVTKDVDLLAQVMREHEKDIEADWLRVLKQAGAVQTGRMREAELQTQCRSFLNALGTAISHAGEDVSQPAYAPIHDLLSEIARSRASQGYSPTETANFVFSLKQVLFNAFSKTKGVDAAAMAKTTWAITTLLDALGLYTLEMFQKSREEVISRQQHEITELSTPVIRLWESILAVPLIGTLDSQRTQIVMENLLQAIVDDGARIAIIDITGVPTVDTLTAQHLLKTVSAARLMGADCIISGIRPQIAQTIVHLGVELNVISKATLADALSVALRRIGRAVVPIKQATREAADIIEQA